MTVERYKIKIGNSKTQFIDGDRSSRYPKREEYVNNGVMFLNSESIKNGVVDESTVNFISDKKYSEIKKGRICKSDILITTRGNGIGNVAFVGTDKKGLINAQMLILRTNPEEISSRFLFYYLTSKSMQSYIHNFSSGAAQPQIPIKDLKQIPLFIFPVGIQRKIAAVLSAYDDLIENNKRRIVLLEKMAEEIYREWFVRMRFPRHEKVKFEKGVPEQWAKTSLSQLGTYLNGYAFGPDDWKDEGIPIIKIKEMTSGISPNTPRNSGENINNKYYFDDGDIIFSWSATLLVLLWDKGIGLLNQHLFKVIPTKNIPKSFVYFSIKFSLDIFESLTTGATMKHIKRKELDIVKINMPTKSVLDAFDLLVQPLVDCRLKLSKANQKLISTRDQLLPRLMSGKLSVENLEIQFPPSMQDEATS